MSDAFLSSDSPTHADYEFDATGEEKIYRIPVAPKIALILNVNAAIWAAAVTLIVTVMRTENNIERIVSLSNLIPSFLIGATVAALSCACDRVARGLYEREAKRAQAWRGVAEICDVSAVGVVLAAYAIFAWGIWSIVTLAALSFR